MNSSTPSFQPSPVKSSSGPSSSVVPDATRSAPDGVGAPSAREDGGGHDRADDANGVLSERPRHPSDAAFVRGGRGGGEATKDGGATVKIKAEPDDDDDDGDGLDGGNWSDDDEDGASSSAEDVAVPTLESYVPRPPSYAKADAVSFFEVCRRLEAVWRLRLPGARRTTAREKLRFLLPDKLLDYLEGGSPYPFLRLILPDADSSRPHTGLKEARIATAWAAALSLPKNGRHCRQLVGFNNPTLVTNRHSVGDLSCVVMDVMAERRPAKGGSKLTVGEANEWLDVLVDVVKDRFDMPTSDERVEVKSPWRRSLERAVASRRDGKRQDRYAALVGKLVDKNLSPVEHKFIVRILMQDIRVGLNLKTVLGYMNKHAVEIFNSFNNLKETCTRLSDPEYVRLLVATAEKNAQKIVESYRNKWMEPSMLPAAIQKTVAPMLSKRTSFDTFLKDVGKRHGELDKALPAGSAAKSCMAIKHPAFLCDIKMDGVRMLIHVHRGVVTMQSRQGIWWSEIYSPAIGPSIRAAIDRYDVDVILDGELIAWNGNEDKPVPFGSINGVAEWNRNRRVRDGTLDERDVDPHKNETDINVVTMAKAKSLKNSHGMSRDLEGLSDKNCWLQYVVFDILYLDGPGAKKLLSKSSHLLSKDKPIPTGSIINLDCMQRKSILYNLIRTQEKVVEHIKSVVVRSDGSTMNADDYFSGRSSLEYGKTPCEFDSIYLAMCDKSGTTKFDSQRMCGRSHEEIEIERSLALEQLYKEVIDSGGQEGLLFKDLASPYYLGKRSRSMNYWWKLKPDYNGSSGASDIDLLVLGGRYAGGYDRRGLVGSVIVGCLGDCDTDREDAKYMALTSVDFNMRNAEKILYDNTGYQRSDVNGEVQLGKWFESEELPDYLSSRSYQRGAAGDMDGWKPNKKDLPDIWIKPCDSFVVTINAGEFQTSQAFQPGFSLRFPRISKDRGKTSDDPKNPDDVDNYGGLKTLVDEQEANHRDEVEFGSQSQQRTSRFLTAKQLQMSGKQKAAKSSRKLTNEVKQFHIPNAGTPLSSVLAGFRFNVQPGKYCLQHDPFAATEAEENDWAKDAKSVKDRLDVIRYIQSHGGICELAVHQGTDFLLGGTATDAKVSNLRTLMANTDMTSNTKKDAEARRLIQMGGILKWTFVYSIVSKFLKNLDDDASGYEMSIKTTCPSLAQPRRSDFLVMSENAITTLQATEDQYGLRINEVASSVDFMRALEEVGRQKLKRKRDRALTSISWQRNAMKNFADNERWIFGGKAQTLWPSADDADVNGMCTLYPDLFVDLGLEEEDEANGMSCVGESPRWKDAMESKRLGEVAAVLPLAKALGAIVTHHLHGGVTHVLCELKRNKMLKWSSIRPLSVFADAESGSRLHERLISLEESAALGGDIDKAVFLVSPDWVEEKWNEKK